MFVVMILLSTIGICLHLDAPQHLIKVSSYTERLPYLLHLVELLPGEELHVDGLRLVVAAGEGLPDHLVLSAHVAVGGGLYIHRLAELQLAFYRLGAQVEELADLPGYLTVGHLDAALAVGVDVDAHWLCNADGVAYLHQHLVGNAGGYHVLGDVACGVGCRAVNLRRVFAREGTAAVGALAAVGIYYYLPARQSRVAVGTADDELARRVDEVFYIIVEQCQDLLATYLALDAGDEDVDDVLTYLPEHALVIVVELVVLRRYHDGVDALGHVVVAVLYGHLTLRVGSEVCHLLTFPPDVGERLHEVVRQVERYGHVAVRLVSGVAEHHALVAGALPHLFLTANAAVDVVALLVDGAEDAARVAVEHVFRLGVADAVDGVARYGLQVNVCLRAHLAHYHHLTGGHETLYGAVCPRVVGEELV